MAAPVFFLIAGEASGDLLGARLMKALKTKQPDARFAGIGGPAMIAEGLDLLFPHTELMHFGVIEVLRHVPRLLRRIRQTVRAVIAAQPAALITIDSPDFCFRVAKRVKKQAEGRIRLIHYVAPSVWAWRPGRAKKIAKFLDHLLAVLPFEPPYFTREGLPCTFVGHSVVESGANKGDGDVFRLRRGIPADTPLLTVLPGSRTSEISRLLPIYRETVLILKAKHPSLQIIVPTVPHLKDRVADAIATWGIPAHIVETEIDKFDAFAASTAALACSGTVALELALAQLPSITVYKLNALTVFLFRRFLRVSYVNLVNIMHNEQVVPELLQENCTPEKLVEALDTLLRDKTARNKQIAKLKTAATWLGLGNIAPSERAAETVLTIATPPAILQVLPALVTGGVERGTVETTAALVRAGFRAIVASAGGPMVSEIEAVGGTHIALPLASKNPVTILANVGRLSRLIWAHKIDIVHVRSRAPAWSAWLAAKKTGASFVTTFHNAYSAKSAIKRLYNSAMAKGERMIAISEFVADYARETYGVPKELLTVIPRGVDIEAFDPSKIDASRPDTLRKEWSLPERTPLILLPGRLTRWKGQLVLLKALAQIKDVPFFCVIVGGGKDTPYGKEVLQALRADNLENRIAIFDTCRDMPAAYSLTDIVVVPSTRPEGFGRVVIEAQAMRKIVIATNHGGAKETILEGKTGFLTPPNDALALAEALKTALSLSPEKRETMAEKAQKHVRDRFTTEAMTSKTLEIYKNLLQKRLSRRREELRASGFSGDAKHI